MALWDTAWLRWRTLCEGESIARRQARHRAGPHRKEACHGRSSARHQEGGRIESFDLILLEPNMFMNGCFILHGTHDQLDAVREDMRFRRSMVDAGLVVDALTITSGYTAEGIQQTLPLYTDAVERVPQMA